MDNIVAKDKIEEFIQERLKKKEPICTLPWTKVWIEEGTKIRNCCYQTNSVGDLSVNSFQEIWNGKIQQDVRGYLLRGKFHPICKCIEKVGSIPVHPEPESIRHAADLPHGHAGRREYLKTQINRAGTLAVRNMNKKLKLCIHRCSSSCYTTLKRICKPYILRHPRLHSLCLIVIKPVEGILHVSEKASADAGSERDSLP
ncbi:MAG: SPASM domain-containing protein [Nitrospirota bacterium]